jgi:hypothetical protein
MLQLQLEQFEVSQYVGYWVPQALPQLSFEHGPPPPPLLPSLVAILHVDVSQELSISSPHG